MWLAWHVQKRTKKTDLDFDSWMALVESINEEVAASPLPETEAAPTG